MYKTNGLLPNRHALEIILTEATCPGSAWTESSSLHEIRAPQADLIRFRECEGDVGGWMFEDEATARVTCETVANVAKIGRQKKVGELPAETE
jgi:hypothetical protein